MSSLIFSVIIDLFIVIISILLIKKIKPNKGNLLNLAFGTFWAGVAGIYFFVALTDISGIFNSVYFSKLFFMLAVILAAVPFTALSLFLSATTLKGKIVWILPAVSILTGLLYVYFVASSTLYGPLIEWTLKYNILKPEAIAMAQYSAYFAFILIALLSLLAFKARKTSTFIQFNSVAVSIGFFFIGGYLDLLGTQGIETVLMRGLIVIGALIGYIGFNPGIKLIKIAHKIS